MTATDIPAGPGESTGRRPTRAARPVGRDCRAVVPVVGKTLEIGLTLLFVGLVTTALYGGVVPDYRTAAADATAEELLTRVTERVETTVPPTAASVRTTVRIDLPGTIGDATYRIAADGDALVLRHPSRGVDASRRPALPDRVEALSGSWTAGTTLTVVVTGDRDGLRVRLTDGRSSPNPSPSPSSDPARAPGA